MQWPELDTLVVLGEDSAFTQDARSHGATGDTFKISFFHSQRPESATKHLNVPNGGLNRKSVCDAS